MTALPAAAAEEGAEAAFSGLEEVIVSAQKREENLQRTAIAVSAVDGDSLINAGVSDITSLSKLVPSLVVQSTVGTGTNFYLRGVGSFAGNAFTENPVAFNYGGVYIARPTAPHGTLFDLERVEVLKGPQGTLYGRNATGGAINVVPRRPSLSGFAGDLTIEYGNYEAKMASGAVNLPLASTAALRIAAQAVDRDGYLSDGYDDENGQAVRASLLAQPNDRLSVLIVADYFDQGGKGRGSVLAPGALAPTAPDPEQRIGGSDPRSIDALRTSFPALINGGLLLPPQDDGFVSNKVWGVAATIDIDLDFASLTVLPAYRDTRPEFRSYNGGYLFQVDEIDKQESLEIRLASDATHPFRYVVGGYLFRERQDNFSSANHGPVLSTQFTTDIRNESAAVFGEMSFDLTERLRLVGGARYTRDDKKQGTTLSQRSFGAGPTSQTSGDATFDSTTYKAGVEFDAGPDSLLYAHVSTGFKSGGFFIAALDNTFDPEEITAYTIGSKNRFFDNRLQLNVEGFYWDYEDQQINFIGPIRTSETTTGQGLATANAGSSRMYGAEVELNLQATREDYFALNVQYLDARYEDFRYTASSATGVPPRTACVVTPSSAFTLPPPGAVFSVNCSDQPQINAPEWTGNVTYEHTFALGNDYELIAGARTRLESSRYLSQEYLPEEQQESYHVSDAYLTLSTGAWSLTAFVNNIEDETVYAGSSLRPVVPVVYNALRPPRTYGARLGIRF